MVCQPGDSDRENHLEQLLAEVEGWRYVSWPPTSWNLLHSFVHGSLLLQVQPCKWDVHGGRNPPLLSTRRIISPFPEFTWVWIPMTSSSCQHLWNVKLLSVHVLCVCKTSSVHYPDTTVLPSGTLNSRQQCLLSLSEFFSSTGISSTLCVSDKTLIKVIHTHTLSLRFCLFLPGVFRSYSGLLAFLSLCFLQILQIVHQDIHVYMTALQQ